VSETLDTLRRAAERNATDAEGWVRLARGAERAGRVDDALAAWARALAVEPAHDAARAALAAPLVAHPQRATWFTRVATLLLDAGAPALAEPFLRQALWLNPHEEVALLRLAELLAGRGRTAGRIVEWDDDKRRGTVETAGGQRVGLHGAIARDSGQPLHDGLPLELTVTDSVRGPVAADPAAIGRPELPFGPAAEAYVTKPRIQRPESR